MKAILLVDHGSRKQAANAALSEMARLVEQRAARGTVVRVAHMELANPTIEEGLRSCLEAGAEEVVVQPFMLTIGKHATEDIPRLVADAAGRVGVRARVAAPLGVHPLLADIVLDRCGLVAS